MICPNCNRELPDDTRFCGGCGTRMLPPEQTPVQEPVQPVQFTETVFDQPVEFVEPVFPDTPEAEPVKPKGNVLDKAKETLKKLPGKYLKLGGIVAAVLVVAIVVLCVFAGGGNGGSGNGSGHPAGALYLKEGELFYSDYSKKGPYEVTSKLLDNASNSTLRSYSYEISKTIHVTEDGKTMFFMDKLSSDGSGTLYWRSLTNFKDDAEKISAGVTRYTVSKDGRTVTYLKGDTLCQYNMKDEEKLEKDVSSYRVSEDGKIIYYKNNDGTWYVLKNGEEEKIGSDISIEYITEDYATVYYMNDDKVYKKTIGKDKEKLLSKVEGISDINEDGTFYYTMMEEKDLLDFFTKDTEEYEGLEEELSGYPMEFYSIGYYDGKDGTIICETCTDSEMENGVLMYRQYDLSAVETIPYSALVAYYYESSQYYVAAAAEEMVNERLANAGALYIAVNGTASQLELEQIDDLEVSHDSTVLYALCEMDYEKDQGVLYKITISGNKIKSTEAIDEDVSAMSGGYFAYGYNEQSGYFCYFKDVKDGTGDLYANGIQVDSGVYCGDSVRATADGKGLSYFVDYDAEKGYGVLKTWNGKEAAEIYDEACGYSITKNGDFLVYYDADGDNYALAVWNGKELVEINDEVYRFNVLQNGDLLVATDYSSKYSSYTLNLWNGKALTEISEDVYTYTILPNNELLYLYDYNTNKCEGELYHWNGRKAVMVDEDVAAIISLPGTTTHYFD